MHDETNARRLLLVLVVLVLCRRRDAYERAELSCGTYEIVATKEYMVRAPQPVIHVFCIDVSQPAVASGATAATCQCIEQVLDSLQGELDALVPISSSSSSGGDLSAGGGVTGLC